MEEDDNLKSRIAQLESLLAAKDKELSLLSSILDNIPEKIYVKDNDGKFVYCNNEFVHKLDKKTKDEVIGKSEYDFANYDVANQKDVEDKNILLNGDITVKQEDSLDKDNGSLKFFSETKIPLKNNNGETIGLLNISKDVSDLVNIESKHLDVVHLITTLMDNIPDHIFFKDAQCRIINSNKAHIKSLGFNSLDEVRGKTDFDLFPRDKAEIYFQQEQDILSGRTKMIDVINQTPQADGMHWLSETKIAVLDKQGKAIGLVGISRDITERKKFEEAYIHERNLLRTLIDNLHESIHLKDMEGRYLLNNRTHLNILGVENQKDTIGKTIYDFHPEQYTSKYNETEMQIIKTGMAILNKEELALHGITGNQIWLLTSKIPVKDSNGKMIGYITISSDITERKRIEQALRYERNLLRTVIDNIPDAIYAKDINCCKTIANMADVHNIGLNSESEVIGKNDYDLFPKDIADTFFADDIKVLKNGESVIGKDEYFFDSQGNKICISTTKVPLKDEKGRIIGIVGIGRNITDRKKLEEEKEKIIADLQKALADIKKLGGLVPICSNCKNIRDDKGYWKQLEEYIEERSEAMFSHGICPACAEKLYPEFFKK